MYKKSNKGFTLVELIVVIVILGILSVIATPKYMNMKREARIATLKGTFGAIKAANLVVKGKATIQSKYNPTITWLESGMQPVMIDGIPTIGGVITPNGLIFALEGFDPAGNTYCEGAGCPTYYKNPNGSYSLALWSVNVDVAPAFRIGYLKGNTIDTTCMIQARIWKALGNGNDPTITFGSDNIYYVVDDPNFDANHPNKDKTGSMVYYLNTSGC